MPKPSGQTRNRSQDKALTLFSWPVFLLFDIPIAARAAGYGRDSHRTFGSNAAEPRLTSRTIPQGNLPNVTHLYTLPASDPRKSCMGNLTFSPSDWRVVHSPAPVARTRTPRDAHSATARALLSQSLFRPSSFPESFARRVRFPAVQARSASAAIHTPPASVCKQSCHSRQT